MSGATCPRKSSGSHGPCRARGRDDLSLWGVGHRRELHTGGPASGDRGSSLPRSTARRRVAAVRDGQQHPACRGRVRPSLLDEPEALHALATGQRQVPSLGLAEGRDNAAIQRGAGKEGIARGARRATIPACLNSFPSRFPTRPQSAQGPLPSRASRFVLTKSGCTSRRELNQARSSPKAWPSRPASPHADHTFRLWPRAANTRRPIASTGQMTSM